jgi:hypothetical protein
MFLTEEAMWQFCWNMFFIRVNYILKIKLMNNYIGKLI